MFVHAHMFVEAKDRCRVMRKGGMSKKFGEWFGLRKDEGDLPTVSAREGRSGLCRGHGY